MDTLTIGRNKERIKTKWSTCKADYQSVQSTECRTYAECTKDIFGLMFEAMLQGEMNYHLGYENNTRDDKDTPNLRNGYSRKKVNNFGWGSWN